MDFLCLYLIPKVLQMRKQQSKNIFNQQQKNTLEMDNSQS
jgi:hypothetical protein